MRFSSYLVSCPILFSTILLSSCGSSGQKEVANIEISPYAHLTYDNDGQYTYPTDSDIQTIHASMDAYKIDSYTCDATGLPSFLKLDHQTCDLSINLKYSPEQKPDVVNNQYTINVLDNFGKNVGSTEFTVTILGTTPKNIPTLSYLNSKNNQLIFQNKTASTFLAQSNDGSSFTSCQLDNLSRKLPAFFLLNTSTCDLSFDPTNFKGTDESFGLFRIIGTNSLGSTKPTTVSISVSSSGGKPATKQTIFYRKATNNSLVFDQDTDGYFIADSKDAVGFAKCELDPTSRELPLPPNDYIKLNTSDCSVNFDHLKFKNHPEGLDLGRFLIVATDKKGNVTDPTPVSIEIQKSAKPVTDKPSLSYTNPINIIYGQTPFPNIIAIANTKDPFANCGLDTTLPDNKKPNFIQIHMNCDLEIIAASLSDENKDYPFTIMGTDKAGLTASSNVIIHVHKQGTGPTPTLSYNKYSNKINVSLGTPPLQPFAPDNTDGIAFSACQLSDASTPFPTGFSFDPKNKCDIIYDGTLPNPVPQISEFPLQPITVTIIGQKQGTAWSVGTPVSLIVEKPNPISISIANKSVVDVSNLTGDRPLLVVSFAPAKLLDTTKPYTCSVTSSDTENFAANYLKANTEKSCQFYFDRKYAMQDFAPQTTREIQISTDAKDIYGNKIESVTIKFNNF